MIRTCSACGRPARKTQTALVFFQAEPPRRARVCGACAARGLLVVASVLPTLEIKKEVRADDVDRAARRIEGQIRAYGAFPALSQEGTEYRRGRVEGLESALAAIKDAGDGR